MQIATTRQQTAPEIEAQSLTALFNSMINTEHQARRTPQFNRKFLPWIKQTINYRSKEHPTSFFKMGK